VSLHLIRHALAGTRGASSVDDAQRPLDATGREQAERVAAHLSDRPITQVLSSPAVRCVQTVAPIASQRSIEVEPIHQLAEGASPAAVVDLLEGLAGAEVALCSHGDVIPEVIRRLASRGMVTTGDAGYAKGSLWTLEADGPRIVSASYHSF
jgi:8-oxo-dGTP diphosphatase